MLLITGAIVAVAMATTAEMARSGADRHRRAEVLVETIRAQGEELSALRAQGAVLLSDARRVIVPPSLLANGFAIWAGLTNSLVALRRLEPDARTARLGRDAARLFGMGLTTLANVSGSTVRAATHGQVNFAAVVEALNLDAEKLAGYEHRSADAASTSAEMALLGSLGLGLITLLLIGGRFQRLTHRGKVEAARRAAERDGEARVRALVEQSSDVVTVVDPELRIRWQAASVTRVLGHDAEALIGQPFSSIAHPQDAALVERFLVAALARPGSQTLSARFEHAHDGWRTMEAIADNRVDEPLIGGLVLSMRDVTERKELEDQLRHQAFHDSLTGLANRSLFENRLGHALAIAQRTGKTFGVLFLDLDDFKTINDSLGHHHGDDVLRTVAARIDEVVRPTDTPARLGGDEFAVLIDIDAGHDDSEARIVARRVLDAVAQPFSVGERELLITASAGLALSTGVEGADELLRNADMAMYAAKADGKAGIRSFEPPMHTRAVERLELTAELRAAVDAGQFLLEYQPIVELEASRIVGVEALVRWEHPVRGRIAPDQFIPLAEDTGLIVPLGLWILRAACAQCHAWRVRYPREELQLSVNVSTRQLHEPDFPVDVAEVLHATGLDPSALTIEITEGVLLGERDDSVSRLRAIKALGVRVAVDDFGTGYSSLSHLRHLPIDTLKIDKSFIDGIEHDQEKAELVRGIVNLGASLQLDMIAEGIERPGQTDEFTGIHQPLAQGFLFFPPLPPGEIDALLASRAQAFAARDRISETAEAPSLGTAPAGLH